MTVDSQMRTADPHILAIGDVAGEPMLAHKATHEGHVAVEVARSASRPRSTRWRFPPSSSPIPKSPGSGLTEEQAKTRRPQVRSRPSIPGPPAAAPSPSAAPKG